MTDKRRYGVIEVRRLNAETYHLTINGVMWSEVEGADRGSAGASKTPPATVSPIPNISSDKIETFRPP